MSETPTTEQRGIFTARAQAPAWIVQADTERARRGLPPLTMADRYHLGGARDRRGLFGVMTARRIVAAVVRLLTLGRVEAPLALPVEPAVEPTPMVSLLTGSLVAMPGAPSLCAAT